MAVSSDWLPFSTWNILHFDDKNIAYYLYKASDDFIELNNK